MFILVKQTKRDTMATLVESYDDAMARAKEHVGDHSPVDGCSTPPSVRQRLGVNGPEFSIARSTSFGPRRAYVRPIGTDFEAVLPL